MEYCAKRWQTREGTYQLKRRRLLPDVRDPPEQEDAEVDMTDIWSYTWMAWRTTSWWKRCYEGLRGARVVSPFLRVFTGRCCVCWVCVVFVCFVCFLSVLLVKTPAFNSRFTFFCEFLVVDRPCPVLARQCRKKKEKNGKQIDPWMQLGEKWVSWSGTMSRCGHGTILLCLPFLFLLWVRFFVTLMKSSVSCLYKRMWMIWPQ